MNDIFDTERASLQNIYQRLGVAEMFSIKRETTLSYTFHAETFAVDRVDHVRYNNVFPAVRIAPGWELKVFKLAFITIGRDTYAVIKADGLVIVDPWLWQGWDMIPEVG